MGERLDEKAMYAGSHWDTHLDRLLALIESASPGRAASIIDVGGGESTLVDDLLAGGYYNLTILDVSQTAQDVTRARLGEAGTRVRWIRADITQAPLAVRSFDVWHDRAVFHFVVAPEQRMAYVKTVAGAVRPGGHVSVSTFGPEGPAKCSGLDVKRYSTGSLHDEFGKRFKLIESSKELHETPFGTTQQFSLLLLQA